jgi:hypothetical protein
MTDPFVHLHVASGYSMRYGANHPADLVARAAEHGMSALALTDRDGLYGAVKFALACRSAGVRPIFGVDLAMAPELGEWATFFAAGAAKRAAAEAGLSRAVTEREADDLVRDVGAFLTVVEHSLGLSVPEPVRPAAPRPRVVGGTDHRR